MKNIKKIYLKNLSKGFFIAFLGICLSCHYAPMSYAETLTFATDEWCPYICDTNIHKGLMGYVADIAAAVFQKAGYDTKFRTIPLKRSVIMCEKGRINAVLAIYKEDAPDFIFPEKEQGISSNIFLKKKGNSWKYNDMKSLEKMEKLGLIGDNAYPEIEGFIKAHPEKITRVKNEDPLNTLLKITLKGRIDAFIDDRAAIQYILKRKQMSGLFVEAGSAGENFPVYIAFSPALPKSEKYAAILSDGMDDLRVSGDLDEILKRYGLEDWKK